MARQRRARSSVPGTGPYWLPFKRRGTSIILMNKHGHEWAELENFPASPEPSSQGFIYTFNLNYPPNKYDAKGRWLGSWTVNQKARQKNMPLFDPNDGWIHRQLAMCSNDTGWRYDTSSGVGGTGGWGGVGGGAQRAHLIMMRKEPSDHRRWDITITAGGVGLMTPGLSAGGSTEDTPSSGLTELRSGPGGTLKSLSDLEGTVMFFDGGVGAAVGRGKAGLGVGKSWTTFLFLSGPYMDGMMPTLAGMKAVLQTTSMSGSGNRGTGLGAQGLVYAGKASVKLRSTK